MEKEILWSIFDTIFSFLWSILPNMSSFLKYYYKVFLIFCCIFTKFSSSLKYVNVARNKRNRVRKLCQQTCARPFLVRIWSSSCNYTIAEMLTGSFPFTRGLSLTAKRTVMTRYFGSTSPKTQVCYLDCKALNIWTSFFDKLFLWREMCQKFLPPPPNSFRKF